MSTHDAFADVIETMNDNIENLKNCQWYIFN